MMCACLGPLVILVLVCLFGATHPVSALLQLRLPAKLVFWKMTIWAASGQKKGPALEMPLLSLLSSCFQF